MDTGTQASGNQMQRALALHLQAVQSSRRAKGDLHPDTLKLANEMLLTVQRARETAVRQQVETGFSHAQLTEMRGVLEEIYESAVTRKGIQDELSRGLANILAEALLMEGNVAGAEELHRKILRLNTETAGRDDEYTLLSMSNLAGVLFQQKKYEEARKLAQEEVGIRKRIKGADDLETVEALKRLALTLNGLRASDMETSVRREILDIYLKRKGPQDSDTTQAAWYLVQLLLSRTGTQQEVVEIVKSCLLWLGRADPSQLTRSQRDIRGQVTAWLQASAQA